MKSVLISIKPKDCELIANGSKTIEVRKTRPKIEIPFKCYIYCTHSGVTVKERDRNIYTDFSGKVIGEFVCDGITKLYNIATDKWDYLSGDAHENEKSCVRSERCSLKAKYTVMRAVNFFTHGTYPTLLFMTNRKSYIIFIIAQGVKLNTIVMLRIGIVMSR